MGQILNVTINGTPGEMFVGQVYDRKFGNGSDSIPFKFKVIAAKLLDDHLTVKYYGHGEFAPGTVNITALRSKPHIGTGEMIIEAPPIPCVYCGQGDQTHATCERAVQWTRSQYKYGHIPDDEPAFVIRARDTFALSAIRGWITVARAGKVSPGKIKGAEEHFEAVQRYQIKHGAKKPD